MSHLSVKIAGGDTALNTDADISLEQVNPFFNRETAEVSSHPFTIPMVGNRHLVSNIDCTESDFRTSSLEHVQMDVEVDGVCLLSGKVGYIEDQEINGNIGIQMVGAVYSLDEYLEGVRCRDVELIDKIRIGETIGELKVDSYGDFNVVLFLTNGIYDTSYKLENTVRVDNQYDIFATLPALGFSKPDISKVTGEKEQADGAAGVNREPTLDVDADGNPLSFINIDEPYPKKSYCNARVCYPHYDIEKNGESSDKMRMKRSKEGAERYNPFYVLDANRPASGICFYVLYFLDCLFARFRSDGVVYDNSELVKIEDLCRLAFFTTHCKFDTERRYAHDGSGGGRDSSDLHDIDAVNKWLFTRNINTKFTTTDVDNEGVAEYEVTKVALRNRSNDVVVYAVGDAMPDHAPGNLVIEKILLTGKSVIRNISANVMDMYANSQNFPNSDAKTILDSLWGSFGIRFYLDQQTRVVKPVFIRDIFRDNSDPINFPCDVIDAVKETENIKGFVQKYSSESDEQAKKDNITTGSTNYDTVYDYQDYARLDASLSYREITSKAYDTNMSCYVDMNTGNLYRIKIDGSADSRKNYHPAVFEVGQLKGIYVGDCSEDDYVEEVVSSFQPIVFDDLSFENNGGSTISVKTDDYSFDGIAPTQILTAFVGEDMWHEDIKRIIDIPAGNGITKATLRVEIVTKESYDVSSSDDGDSPLQSIDWGLAVAIMRGGGSENSIDYYDYDYDMFGNCKYRRLAGNQYTMSLDSIDCYSQQYDYNGPWPGIGQEDRISLKIRSYIEAPYDVVGPDGNIIPKGTPLCNPAVKNRGLFDKFFSEYAHFVLHRKKVKLYIMCEPSALVGIQWTKRYRFGDYVGWINKINTHITAENGIEKCEVELFML